MNGNGFPAGADAVLALGSNMGDKAGNIAAALRELAREGDIAIVRRSRNYRTPPWGNTEQDWFLNACAAVATRLSPEDLLARCLETERRLGRVRAEKWGPRVIDIDLLLYRDVRLSGPDLTLPHPYLTARAFVLVPLAEIAPGLTVAGRTVEDWLACVGSTGIEPF